MGLCPGILGTNPSIYEIECLMFEYVSCSFRYHLKDLKLTDSFGAGIRGGPWRLIREISTFPKCPARSLASNWRESVQDRNK